MARQAGFGPQALCLTHVEKKGEMGREMRGESGGEAMEVKKAVEEAELCSCTC